MGNSTEKFDSTLCSGAYQFIDGGGTAAHGTVVFHIPQQPIKGRATTDEAKRAIIERLYTLWTQWPHLRLGQLIFNVDSYPYYREDDHLLTVLEQSYAALSRERNEDEG